jgi:regulator of sigma E protease
MSLAVAILALAMLVLLHEAGHFFTARAVGMRPRKFYVGFPPAIAKVSRGGIEYGIGAIPLGGYVKIPGMHRPAPSDVDLHLGRASTRRCRGRRRAPSARVRRPVARAA